LGEGGAAIVILLMLTLAPAAHAVSNPAELMADPKQEARAEAIGHQLRCLVCQNESVEDSEADLARDLRKIIRARVLTGDSNEEIIAWMTARYGDFVRLRPPFNALTAALWGAPVIALLVGGGAVVLARRRRNPAPAPLSDEERRRLADLLRS
jgi:cytochrome c-type biogenesis protein CcmH